MAENLTLPLPINIESKYGGGFWLSKIRFCHISDNDHNVRQENKWNHVFVLVSYFVDTYA